MVASSVSVSNNRLGIHYYHDTQHYREKDLEVWLPELRMMGVSWLTLLAPSQRAIPENFLNPIQSAGIQPILQIPLTLSEPVQSADFRILLAAYARWGLRYVVLFDRPNSQAAWSTGLWTQLDLIERFLDVYLPLAEIAMQEGLTPIFPPLEPGGDYWDLAFLRGALRGIQRRGKHQLLETLVLGVYALAGNRPLDWGEGGIDRWPGARPYNTSPEVQDHLGFRIFDWYQDIVRQELDLSLPLILFRSGSALHDQIDPSLPPVDEQTHKERNLSLIKSLAVETTSGASQESLPSEILASNFWLLASEPLSPFASQAWFQQMDHHLPIVDALRRQAAASYLEKPFSPHSIPINKEVIEPSPDVSVPSHTLDHSIHHYVLLPLYGWGVAEWDLNLIQPLLEQSHPTIGFSLVEARMAERVTVVGGESIFPEESLKMLRDSGCAVERILENGTVIAT
jgi:hypothetical protein